MYKLKTAKVFEKSRSKDDKPSTDIVDEDPYAIQIISWCPESRMLCIAGVSAHVIIYRFSKQEVITEVIPVMVSWLFQCQMSDVLKFLNYLEDYLQSVLSRIFKISSAFTLPFILFWKIACFYGYLTEHLNTLFPLDKANLSMSIPYFDINKLP